MSTPANTPIAGATPTTVTTWSDQNRDARRGVHRVLVTPTGNQKSIRVCEPISRDRKMPPPHRRSATSYDLMRNADDDDTPIPDVDRMKQAAENVRNENPDSKPDKKDEKKA